MPHHIRDCDVGRIVLDVDWQGDIYRMVTETLDRKAPEVFLPRTVLPWELVDKPVGVGSYV